MKVEGKFNFNICRVCLENVSKLYPLEGPIPNVDVEITSMIAYCTSIQIELSDGLPNGVCIPCFRILRIAYNFINQFKDSHKVLTEKKWKYALDVLKIDNEGPEICNEEIIQEHDIDDLCSCNGYTLQKYDEYGHIEGIIQLQDNIKQRKT